MNGKYQPGQKVFLTGGNKNLIKEATVLKYAGGFYTIRFDRVVVSKSESPGSSLLGKKLNRRS